MRTIIASLAAATALAGCAADEGPGRMPATQDPAVQDGPTITYSTAPCFGVCPVYTVTVHADGHGTFVGRQHVAAEGEREFVATQHDLQLFQEVLAPYRPASGEKIIAPGQNCEHQATDMASVDVRWTAPDGTTQHLDYYYGCDMEKNREMAKALRNAPQYLPIGAMIEGR
ncbi:DUF6438 domain-containing protein [Stakelama saccharophila]|uniref:DUF6438 domain-containing protein n=1 Tax=Stakelama saccharophila TaxID=3075605 RepID=A0ABZ0B7R1_9SPHN|nr:DUF6438 domain-containing protein [Stakelama sp. W311]WNO53277.1 DUF6438 domain-containing protein [Stakelama sp. W311]